MLETAEAEFPALFRHKTREDWGVGVLSGERDGKRTYLFEGGEERVMGRGTLDMMMKVPPSTADLRSTLARLTALVARRHGLPDATKGTGAVLLDQIAMLRRTFPQGLQDPAWQTERYAARARTALVAQAQDLLSLKSLDARLKAQQFDALWASVAQLLGSTGWVPAEQLKPVPALGLGLLAGAVRELLYGSATLEQRVDRFSIAFETAFQRPARWETTTSLLCLVFPDSHVLVDLVCFRKQLKSLGGKGPLPAGPKGAAYTRCLNAARIIASKLAEQGEAPADLLDVHDFIRFTCKASPPARRSKAVVKAAPKKQSRSAETEADADAEDTSDAD